MGDPWDVIDLYAGTGSSTEAWTDRGHRRFTVELDTRHPADLHADVTKLTVNDLRDLTGHRPGCGRRLMVWASCPCTCFSVASMGHHWTGGRRAYIPATVEAVEAQRLVAYTLELIRGLGPDAWLIENPRGMLHKLPVMAGVPHRTVWYCRYGDDRAKPTNLFGYPPAGWVPRPPCRNGRDGLYVEHEGRTWVVDEQGRPCHEAAERGAKTGTQGREKTHDRSRVPYELGLSLALAAEGTPEPQPNGQHALAL